MTSLSKAAVLADEFVLTHKNVFVPPFRPDRASVSRPVRPDPVNPPFEKARGPQSPPRGDRECFYCHKKGHIIADCLSLKRKQQLTPSLPQPKGMGLIKNVALPGIKLSQNDDKLDPCFKPFISKGFVSLTGDPKDQQPVNILRDTGGSQSIIREGILPLSSKSACNSSAVVQGVEMGFVPVPLHYVYIQSPLVSGLFKVAVRPALPIKGVDFILSNDLAGGKVMPVPEVLDNPELNTESDKAAENNLDIFPACVVTRAQSKKYGPDLSDSFLVTDLFPDTVVTRSKGQPEAQLADAVSPLSCPEVVKLLATREEFIAAQQDDITLAKCLSSVLSKDEAQKRKMAYVLEDGLLMRRWTSDVSEEVEWNATYQVVVPTAHCP